MFQPPPLPPATGLRRLRAGGIGLLLVVLSAGVAPSFLPGAAGAGPALLAAAGRPSDAEWARLRYLAWLRGRQDAADAGRDRAAARQAAAGGGATWGAWVVPPGGDRTIPALALRAYREAAAWAAGFDPGCRLSWSVLAGIGRIESNHGMHGGAATRFSPSGTVSPRITGPPLDGRGVARIPDSDAGRWDGDTAWDRAVGPMQFIPSTWRSLGRDGNGDGVSDPNNLFDSTVAAAAYLCLSVDGSLADPAQLRQAVYNYNHSWPYVDAVLGWASLYDGGVTVGASAPSGSAGPGTSGTTGPSSTAASTSTTRATTTSRRPTTSERPTTTTRPTSTTRPSTTGSSTTTTKPCRTTTTTTTSSSSSTTTTSTTTTTLPGSSTTTTTLPPCE
jgi:membrane-bound lytic murein transglycosylase B